jgi:ATP-dependent RNA helicase DeaD
MSTKLSAQQDFHNLGLSKQVLMAIKDVGYEIPTPIQTQTIPQVLAGKDILGQAQTGTGKTAAFAMPLLSQIDLSKKEPQVLVLAPTRELAIQVAEAFQQYAAHLKGFHVLPIYGGQEYGSQIRRLKRGVHVVVGTPGRVMDHIRRGTLKLEELTCLVLDEADEMLSMGFIEDIEWILKQTPAKRQIALFSATLPIAIRRIAQKYLRNPVEISIKTRTATVETTRQRFWMVNGLHKLDALTRILETEPFEAILIFVRTKTATVELSEKLEARGYASAPLNGDMKQTQRERTITRLRSGKLNILVATDVAARGLDVDRISHVINYDIPYDPEAYVHRIGRTGRAGREGEAILFVSPRERGLLHAIEKATKQKIEPMEMPSMEMINDKRITGLKQRITKTLAAEELGFFYRIVEQYQREQNIPALEIAAALLKMLQGDSPFLLIQKSQKIKEKFKEAPRKEKFSPKRNKVSTKLKRGMERFRIEVGHNHKAKPGNIVGAIANEAGMDSEFIGRINIFDDFSTVDLPKGMPDDVFQLLKKVYVAGRQLEISRFDNFQHQTIDTKKGKFRPKHKKRRKNTLKEKGKSIS